MVKDPKFTVKTFHYTAWYRKDKLQSLIDLCQEDYSGIKRLIDNAQDKVPNNCYIYIHYKPQFWRLHIHFVKKERGHDINKYKFNRYPITEVLKNLSLDRVGIELLKKPKKESGKKIVNDITNLRYSK